MKSCHSDTYREGRHSKKAIVSHKGLRKSIIWWSKNNSIFDKIHLVDLKKIAMHNFIRLRLKIHHQTDLFLSPLFRLNRCQTVILYTYIHTNTFTFNLKNLFTEKSGWMDG